MKSWITTPQVTELLGTLYADAAKNDPRVHQAATEAGVTYESEADFFKAMREAYLPVGREFGNLLYALARSSKSKRWWNFGTSFGISTIFLASAIRDNGMARPCRRHPETRERCP
jgi:predicted O-methyltransferase YrrM